MSKFTCLVLCIVAASLTKVSAISAEDKAALHAALEPIIAECSEEHGVSDGDIKAAKESENVDAIKPCFLGCIMKKTQVMDSKGMYDVEKGLGELKKYVKNEDDLAKFEEIGKTCASVNEQEVSDGEEGCERAKLVLTCFFEHKAELPI